MANKYGLSLTSSLFSLLFTSLYLVCLSSCSRFTLDSVRDALIREEDSIVFSLIERARFPYNAPAYDSSFLGNGLSIAELYVRESESLQAKVHFLSIALVY